MDSIHKTAPEALEKEVARLHLEGNTNLASALYYESLYPEAEKAIAGIEAEETRLKEELKTAEADYEDAKRHPDKGMAAKREIVNDLKRRIRSYGNAKNRMTERLNNLKEKTNAYCFDARAAFTRAEFIAALTPEKIAAFYAAYIEKQDNPAPESEDETDAPAEAPAEDTTPATPETETQA